ncbi:MAG: inositol monophosphatase family protein [Planctomycetaceae bacterium]
MGRDLQEYQQAAEAAARAGGEALKYWSEKFTVSEKGRADLVTEADVASQKAILDCLQTQFPRHGFLGEEGLSVSSGDSDYRWVIDPLDGTSNYVHRFPYYAVSIGLQLRGELIVGVIYDPTRNELFCAARGGGAYLDGKRLQPSRFGRLCESMVIASFPPGVTAQSAAMRRFLNVLPHAQTIHRSGSSALNMAYVAAGRLDGYWSTSLKPWDMAAGVLLVREAGGRVTRTDGQPIDIEVPDLLCTNGTGIHDELQTLLSLNETVQ